MRKLNERVKVILEETGWKQAELARNAGVTRASINDWLRDDLKEEMKVRPAISISKHCRFAPLWIASGYGERYSEDQKDSDAVEFSLLNIEAAAGDGKNPPGYVEPLRKFTVSKDWARRVLGYGYEKCKMITARGTSMSGTIEDGDLLFVDVSIKYFDGDGVYVISMDNDIKVKRLQSLPGKRVKIISDNKKFDSPVLDESSGVTIEVHGRVIKALTIKDIV